MSRNQPGTLKRSAIDGKQAEGGGADKPGPPGPKGDDGLSAYQVWLEAGNKGTEADFLASLKGAKGDTGTPGAKGDTGAKGDQGIQGAKGDAGTPGAKGDTGADGKQGIQGEKGQTGAPGVQGDKGDKDEKGDTGPAGKDAPAGVMVYYDNTSNKNYSLMGTTVNGMKTDSVVISDITFNPVFNLLSIGKDLKAWGIAPVGSEIIGTHNLLLSSDKTKVSGNYNTLILNGSCDKNIGAGDYNFFVGTSIGGGGWTKIPFQCIGLGSMCCQYTTPTNSCVVLGYGPGTASKPVVLNDHSIVIGGTQSKPIPSYYDDGKNITMYSKRGIVDPEVPFVIPDTTGNLGDYLQTDGKGRGSWKPLPTLSTTLPGMLAYPNGGFSTQSDIPQLVELDAEKNNTISGFKYDKVKKVYINSNDYSLDLIVSFTSGWEFDSAEGWHSSGMILYDENLKEYLTYGETTGNGNNKGGVIDSGSAAITIPPNWSIGLTVIQRTGQTIKNGGADKGGFTKTFFTAKQLFGPSDTQKRKAPVEHKKRTSLLGKVLSPFRRNKNE